MHCVVQLCNSWELCSYPISPDLFERSVPHANKALATGPVCSEEAKELLGTCSQDSKTLRAMDLSEGCRLTQVAIALRMLRLQCCTGFFCLLVPPLIQH
jgi:hypothetical protein